MVRRTGDKLTATQEKVLDFISSEISGRGIPPTYDEIAAHFNFKSKNAVETHLQALIKKGYIRKLANRSRGLVVSRPSRRHGVLRKIPLLGSIAAGQPVYAEQNIEEYIDFTSFFSSSSDIFALRVKGDSMVEAGIYDGDVVVIRKQPRVDNGQIGAVLVDDEATIKRVYMKSNSLRLKPENTAMKDIVVSLDREHCMVLGKMIGLIRKVQ